jgi:type I thyroxine 5'-deiodinase
VSLQKVYEQYKDRADFWWVYIREAHPTDSARPARHVQIEQPKTFLRRTEVAGQCSAGLKLKIPCVVDDMQDSVARAYDAFPDRLYILNAKARIAFKGGRGPRGFSVSEMEDALRKLLASKEKAGKK